MERKNDSKITTESENVVEWENRLVSSLRLMGETLLPEQPNARPSHAASRDVPLLTDLRWLTDMMAAFHQAVANDPQLAELLERLPQIVADGELLRLLYGYLFPEQKDIHRTRYAPKGKSVLTKTQTEILRMTAQGKTPAQIADSRKCSETNVTNVLSRIKTRLNADSTQEAVMAAISMNYIPLDVLDWVRTGNVAVKDYSPLDSLLSYGSSQPLPTDYWRRTASLGLLLLLATHTGVGAYTFQLHSQPANGVLFRLEPLANGTYRVRQIVNAGRLHSPTGIVVAPVEAEREGFTSGNLFVLHCTAVQSACNRQEITEWTPSGSFVRAFSGGQTITTCLDGGWGLNFTSTGSLLVTTSGTLIEFIAGGKAVENRVNWCCTDVDTDDAGTLYLAHFSTRGGSLGIYSPQGTLLSEWEPQKPMCNFYGVRLLREGRTQDIITLWHDTKTFWIRVYDEQGRQKRCWQVPGGMRGAFALDKRNKRLFAACGKSSCVAVYSLHGTLQTQIPLDSSITPTAVTLDSDGTLYVSGTAS